MNQEFNRSHRAHQRQNAPKPSLNLPDLESRDKPNQGFVFQATRLLIQGRFSDTEVIQLVQEPSKRDRRATRYDAWIVLTMGAMVATIRLMSGWVGFHTMAGAKPEYLPVIIAAIEAIADPRFDLLHMTASTGSFSLQVLVTGELGKQLKLNSGIGLVGYGWQFTAQRYI